MSKFTTSNSPFVEVHLNLKALLWLRDNAKLIKLVLYVFINYKKSFAVFYNQYLLNYMVLHRSYIQHQY